MKARTRVVEGARVNEHEYAGEVAEVWAEEMGVTVSWDTEGRAWVVTDGAGVAERFTDGELIDAWAC